MSNSTGDPILDAAIDLSADLANDTIFDDLVHELKAQEAANINNEGYAVQLIYIASRLGSSSAMSEVQSALRKEQA